MKVLQVLTTIFKFFAILVINGLVLLIIQMHRKTDVSKMSALQSNSSRKYWNSTLILLASVLLYLITQLPSLIMNILLMAAENKHYDLALSVRRFANPFVIISFLTNYSVNFFLYITVSRKFRAQFKKIFGGIGDGKPMRVWHRFWSTITVFPKEDHSKQRGSRAALFPKNRRKNSFPTREKSVIALVQ